MPGLIALSSSSRFPLISEAMRLKPVMIPPGRVRLATNPADCAEHGVLRITVPWAREGSRFTLLFEHAALMLVREMPVLAAARIIEITDHRLPGPPWPLPATIPASPPSSRESCCRQRAHSCTCLAPTAPDSSTMTRHCTGLSHFRDTAGSTPERKVPPAFRTVSGGNAAGSVERLRMNHLKTMQMRMFVPPCFPVSVVLMMEVPSDPPCSCGPPADECAALRRGAGGPFCRSLSMMRNLMAGALIAAVASTSAFAADPAAGEKVFKSQCSI